MVSVSLWPGGGLCCSGRAFGASFGVRAKRLGRVGGFGRRVRPRADPGRSEAADQFGLGRDGKRHHRRVDAVVDCPLHPVPDADAARWGQIGRETFGAGNRCASAAMRRYPRPERIVRGALCRSDPVGHPPFTRHTDTASAPKFGCSGRSRARRSRVAGCQDGALRPGCRYRGACDRQGKRQSLRNEELYRLRIFVRKFGPVQSFRLSSRRLVGQQVEAQNELMSARAGGRAGCG